MIIFKVFMSILNILFNCLNLILVVVFLHLKLVLDLSLIKYQLINKTKEELKFRNFV